MLTKKPHARWLFSALLLTSLIVSGEGPGQQPEDLESTIQFLLNHVAGSGLTFIRNSGRHAAADAAEHMNSKYEYFRDKIKSPEDFIQRCASKSLMSGEPYLVVLKNGAEVRTAEWLLRALTVYRSNLAADPARTGQ